MTLPALLIRYSGDNCIFPSDADLIVRSLATRNLTQIEIDGDHYGFPAETGREGAVAAIIDWLKR